ncbi:MAG: putative DNA binding domain-containing protein, partial [Muribaculaceae bacterium]|nr:putative DNA binding domain-containing protein [Muribaculaceae bacterium]
MDQSIITESFKIQSFLEDLRNNNENKQIELKSVKGGFPDSFWETYSSFANTEGGIILFGINEKNHIFSASPLSVEDVEKFKKEFFNNQNNQEKVSVPLLTDKDVKILPYGHGYILEFIVPRATREQRPVYVGTDPMIGTFGRDKDGDFRCDSSVVGQMIAERDSSIGKIESRVLNNYTWDDIDMNSFRQYRSMFANITPTHPWNALSDLDLMRKLGGYRKDRETGKEGFTLAGILMFGKEEAITDPECAPDFMVEYREIPSDSTAVRWIDRLYPDGTWEANLFQFYRLVLSKLDKFISKPETLSEGWNENSPIHTAVREALINCLVHAQYGGAPRIKVYKTPKGIIMSNPGTLLVSMPQYYEGGKSEPRNPALQKMFGLIGKSDKAGSGVDKILQGWKEANWQKPYIEETGKLDKVELYLPIDDVASANDINIEEANSNKENKDVASKEVISNKEEKSVISKDVISDNGVEQVKNSSEKDKIKEATDDTSIKLEVTESVDLEIKGDDVISPDRGATVLPEVKNVNKSEESEDVISNNKETNSNKIRSTGKTKLTKSNRSKKKGVVISENESLNSEDSNKLNSLFTDESDVTSNNEASNNVISKDREDKDVVSLQEGNNNVISSTSISWNVVSPAVISYDVISTPVASLNVVSSKSSNVHKIGGNDVTSSNASTVDDNSPTDEMRILNRFCSTWKRVDEIA